ncbi:DUF5103 domain-containing protein [Lutimonas zeaxanthinifaciens]|uniref:type IX secretion system plug protein n=1 Tax=Lutimonas zeaxanthinifaciens TaxID=3060215 RepID=UPI00265CCDB9|nr:DUF5103 domain-containing protein [Lutimonas sp. YSD2104]WKK65536.1 DUF5103 domain-containing protein [Lutimonas sp. YSD2104]
MSVNVFFRIGLLFILIGILGTPQLRAQQNNIIPPPPHIKTIEFKPLDPDAYAPVVKLGEKLKLSFDDINADQRIYSYKIEHCDYNWQISNLSSTEYMTGYASDRIRNYQNSFNTLQYYTHYELEIPNENNRIKLSGNYLISILDDYGNVLFTRRFIMYQPKVIVAVSAHRSTDPSKINEKHSIQFVINHPNLVLNDPSREIKVDVYQNNDWNSVIKEIKPKNVLGTQLWYNYIDGISYWAGNEYLYFDTKEIRNATNNIFKTRLDNIFNTYLYATESRGHLPYSFYPDVNGNFVLRTLDADDVSLEGDYSFVHFSLKYDRNFDQDDIYIYGNFNDWQITPENKMEFNEESGLYEATMMMKQGFYNYTYVAVNSDFRINPYKVEGSYYQTENEYTVIVYYRKFGDRYDQAIGLGTTNSEKLQN